jgi:hypothetical protein
VLRIPFLAGGAAEASEVTQVALACHVGVGDRHIVGETGHHRQTGVRDQPGGPATVSSRLIDVPAIQPHRGGELFVIHAAWRSLRRGEVVDVLTLEPCIGQRIVDRTDSPRVARALQLLTDELNATPASMPGDHRPLTYQLADA